MKSKKIITALVCFFLATHSVSIVKPQPATEAMVGGGISLFVLFYQTQSLIHEILRYLDDRAPLLKEQQRLDKAQELQKAEILNRINVYKHALKQKYGPNVLSFNDFLVSLLVGKGVPLVLCWKFRDYLLGLIENNGMTNKHAILSLLIMTAFFAALYPKLYERFGAQRLCSLYQTWKTKFLGYGRNIMQRFRGRKLGKD